MGDMKVMLILIGILDFVPLRSHRFIKSYYVQTLDQ